MSYERFTRFAYVACDGNYSQSEDIILFDFNQLSDEQWDILDALPDQDRFWYVYALLNGEDVSEFEE